MYIDEIVRQTGRPYYENTLYEATDSFGTYDQYAIADSMIETRLELLPLLSPEDYVKECTFKIVVEQ